MMFSNKTVVITGASSGIGKSTSFEFAKRGANLILVSRNQEKLNELENSLKKFNVKTMVCVCDVSNKTEVQKMSKLVLEKFSHVDILVNNAGFAIFDYVKNLTIEQIEDQMNTNYFGMIYCIKNFLPSMIDKNSGHIVNVASVAASFGLPGIAPYCASKYAMLGFSEGLKHELSSSNVDVTVVSPIMVRTNFFNHSSFKKIKKSSFSLSPETVAKTIVKASTSKRLEIIVPSFVRVAIWIKHTIPYVINPILGKSFKNKIDSE